MVKIGFIGAGNMGGAIIAGMIKSENFESQNINVCDRIISDDVASMGVKPLNLRDTCLNSDCIVLAVKPNVLASVLEEIKTVNGFDIKLYISIAAGYSLDSIKGILGKVRAVRVMPNLCLKAGEGMTVMCNNDVCTPDDVALADKIFSSCGKVLKTKESLIDSCTAINGSGPAYVFMFMEALADGAVKHGIDRESAYVLAAQTVLGSAKLMLDSKIHPGQLKDMVCSPGGTTIEAVASLEQNGLRDAVISAVDECVKKAQAMSLKN